MKLLAAVMAFALAIALLGCAPVQAGHSASSAVSSSRQTSLDQAVRDLKARADAGDVSYFTARAFDTSSGVGVMNAIAAADLPREYKAHLKSSSSTATIDGHDLGYFQVSLVRQANGWTVDRVSMCW